MNHTIGARSVLAALVSAGAAAFPGCASTTITYTTIEGARITYASSKDQDWSVTLPDGTIVQVKGTATTVNAQALQALTQTTALIRALAGVAP